MRTLIARFSHNPHFGEVIVDIWQNEDGIQTATQSCATCGQEFEMFRGSKLVRNDERWGLLPTMKIKLGKLRKYCSPGCRARNVSPYRKKAITS